LSESRTKAPSALLNQVDGTYGYAAASGEVCLTEQRWLLGWSGGFVLWLLLVPVSELSCLPIALRVVRLRWSSCLCAERAPATSWVPDFRSADARPGARGQPDILPSGGPLIALALQHETGHSPGHSDSLFLHLSAYIVEVSQRGGRYLILRRRSSYLSGTWQQVSGHIEDGETGWQAALREIAEETGLIPNRLYSANQTEIFYEHRQNCINIVPIFVAFLETHANVVLSEQEHDAFKWIAAAEAREFLPFDNQVAAINYIEERFVKQHPPEFLRIAT
jgi:dihydroneopterin triphosphate diphosphatase